MRVAFRVDASAVIGIGHLKRCLAVAHALDRLGADILFVTRDLGTESVAMIEAEGFAATKLGRPSSLDPAPADPRHATWAGVSQEVDADETCAVLGVTPCDWVVVDHYAFDQAWHRRVATRAGRKICVIDDLADRPLRADLVVDHNPAPDHRAKYAHVASNAPRVLGGPRFALLAPAYAEAAPYLFKPQVDSIGVFMGGADAIQASELALRACREVAGFRGRMQVATTSANRHLDDLRALCLRMGDTELLVDLPDLVSFFQRHDFQIGAGGGAAWERCCLGVPTLTLHCAANQAVVLDALEALGATRTVSQLTADAVGKAVASLVGDPAARRMLCERARGLVDGQGATRVALALFANADAVNLRPARNEDAEQAHAWRNDERTRRYFTDPSAVPWETHRDWWSRTLGATNRRLMVACCGTARVGTVRLDLTGGDAELSFYVDPELTGLGLGTAILRATQRWAAALSPRVERVTATVHPDNVASAGAFRAAGFLHTSPLQWTWEVPR